VFFKNGRSKTMSFFGKLPFLMFLFAKSKWRMKNSIMTFGKDDEIIVFCHTYCLDSLDRLTKATEESLRKAAVVCRNYPFAKILFGNCSFPAGMEEKELVTKRNFLLNEGIAPDRVIELGGVANTVEEVTKAILFLKDNKKDKLFVITEEACSRGQLLLWRKLLPPYIKFSWRVVDGCYGWGSHCLYSAQKGLWIWLLSDVVRYFLYIVFGAKAGFLKEKAD
jgi:uncharacterized SAM-binding protein YcdF (DUF218 family)